jgi:hypothetical protein
LLTRLPQLNKATGLVEVQRKVRTLLKPQIASWDQTIHKAIQQFQEKYPEETTLTLALFKETDNKKKYVEIFKGLADRIRQLEQENSDIVNLPASYVSNKVERKKI